jgi:hypothetical protein
MRRSVWARWVLGAAALAFASVPARAQFPDDTPDNFRLRVGGLFAKFDSNTTLSKSGTPGDNINLTNLGLVSDTKNTFRGEGYWNFLGRMYLDFGYVDFTLDGTRSITKDIHFNGLVYKAGAEVSGETSSRYIYAAFRYGIIKNPTFHLGLSLGVTYTSETAKLSAKAGVQRPDGTVVSGGASVERSVDVPIPLIGLDMEFKIAKGLTLGARARGIGATVDPYSGSWVEYAGSINWYFSQNFGVSGAYEYQKLHLKKDESTPDAFRFDQQYDGPRISVIVTF